MTANITVLVQKIDSVLIIPGKALRFTPDAAYLAEYMKNNPSPRDREPGGTGQGRQNRKEKPEAGYPGRTRSGQPG